MQKKNLLRLLALAMTLVMALALAIPALAETDDEIEAVVEEEEILEEEVVEEEEIVEEEPEEIEIPEFAWTKYFSVPVYEKMDAKSAPMKNFKTYTRVKVVEQDEVWTKIEYGIWYNNLDGQGNQIMWIPAYVLTGHLTSETPLFQTLYNVYVAR